MDSLDIVLTIISVFGTLSSILFAFLAFKRNDRKDRQEEGKDEGILFSELGYIKSSIDRIQQSLDVLEEINTTLSNKLVKVEESTANAHKRITEHMNDNVRHIGGKNT